jgi:hypothetical protein
MVDIAQARGLAVYHRLAELPGCESLAEPDVP